MTLLNFWHSELVLFPALSLLGFLIFTIMAAVEANKIHGSIFHSRTFYFALLFLLAAIVITLIIIRDYKGV